MTDQQGLDSKVFEDFTGHQKRSEMLVLLPTYAANLEICW